MANDFHIPYAKNIRRYAIDLDGTLCWPTWKPDQVRTVVGDPIPENIAKLNEVVDQGYEVFIHTARPWTDYELIEAWLEHHGIPYTGIVCGKILAHRYVDDRGINARNESWL